MAGNVINSGLNLMNTAYNGAGGTVLSGDAVKGGYFVTDTIANIPSWSNVVGTLCYVTGTATAPVNKFYQYNGTSWVEKIATTSTDGFMSATDKTKLAGIEAQANKYIHPTYTAKTSGLYKITVDSSGHVSNTTAVTKSDITGIGIPGEADTDATVKLATELKTYYNVGRITNASGTNPVTIGNVGDTLRQVFNNLFTMDEVQPSIKQQPSVSCSFSSNASDERGTTISSISYTITFNDGEYTNASSTGVSMTGYSFSSGTASSTTATSGTLTLPSTYIVGTSSAFSTTLTANHSQGNIAKTNLGNNSNPTVRISSGSKTSTPSFSKTAVDYPYFASSSSTAASTAASAKQQKSTSLTSTSGESCTYGAGAYVWIFVRKGTATSQATKTIETYSDIAKAWGTLLGGTEKKGEVTFKKANGIEDTFYAYKTKNAAQAGATFTLRLK